MREARAGSRPPGLKSAEPLTRKALPMDSIQVPARVKNLTGMMFGRLEVIAYAGIDKHRTAKWVCRCTGPHCAGKQVIVLGTRLRKGHTRSCGCLSSEMSAERARDLGAQDRKRERAARHAQACGHHFVGERAGERRTRERSAQRAERS